ncbi:MAG: PEP-utilizing enzyme [Patescibacteria group bacterium]|nr:PEP-utilizing enzyme [Patescibacteria group bacterium]
MDKWKLLVARETVLLERYIRVEGYRDMLGAPSKVKVGNLLVINQDGITSQYVYLPETAKRLDLVWAEYQQGYLKKFFPLWSGELEELKKSTKAVLANGTAKNFSIFIKWYKLARSIVFYTNNLNKLFESKKLKKETLAIGEWHEKAEVESSAAWDALMPFFEKLGRKHKTSPAELMFYLPKEFFKFLQEGKKVGEKILQERKKHYVLWLQNGRMKFYLGKQARQVEMEQVPPEKIAPVKEIKGMVACRGKATGKVRVVNTKAQMERMQAGEILVSIMTTPRLLAATKKASAIITDEGGITCHAAIISREFKIPCIIGTKNASKILKDGDFVEVDADSGIVKIL